MRGSEDTLRLIKFKDILEISVIFILFNVSKIVGYKLERFIDFVFDFYVSTIILAYP